MHPLGIVVVEIFVDLLVPDLEGYWTRLRDSSRIVRLNRFRWALSLGLRIRLYRCAMHRSTISYVNYLENPSPRSDCSTCVEKGHKFAGLIDYLSARTVVQVVVSGVTAAGREPRSYIDRSFYKHQRDKLRGELGFCDTHCSLAWIV